MKASGIYMIQSISKPERIYIGSSYYMKMRKSQHLYDLRGNKHGNGRLQNHFNKYGEDDLIFSIIATCSKEELQPINGIIWLEQFFIDVYNPYFNISRTAGSNMGYRFTDEQRKRVSDGHMGQQAYWKGKSLSLEHKENLSISHRGLPIWNKGVTLSKEHCQHLSESHIGTGLTPIIQYDRGMNFIKAWESIKNASEELGISRTNISTNLSGKTIAAGGFIWKHKFEKQIA